MFLRDQNIRKAFVVPQQHVVARLQLLDQVLFKQKRLGLGARGQEHHRGRVADHSHDPGAVTGGARIGRHPRLEVPRLADVKHGPFFIQHPIDTRTGIQRLQIGLNDLKALGGRCVG